MDLNQRYSVEEAIEFITGSDNDTGSAETCQENLDVSFETVSCEGTALEC